MRTADSAQRMRRLTISAFVLDGIAALGLTMMILFGDGRMSPRDGFCRVGITPRSAKPLVERASFTIDDAAIVAGSDEAVDDRRVERAVARDEQLRVAARQLVAPQGMETVAVAMRAIAELQQEGWIYIRA